MDSVISSKREYLSSVVSVCKESASLQISMDTMLYNAAAVKVHFEMRLDFHIL